MNIGIMSAHHRWSEKKKTIVHNLKGITAPDVRIEVEEKNNNNNNSTNGK